MLVVVSKEDIQLLLQDEIKSWEKIGGGPNLNAFFHDEKSTDPQTLKQLGYYDNRDSWLAGRRISILQEYLRVLESKPQYTGK